jgi:hypothetical protein
MTEFDKCKQEIKEQKQKQEKIKKFVGITAFFMPLCVGLGAIVGLLIGQVENSKREKRIDKQVKQYERTLPYYNEYKQTQEKIANYRDSLTRAGR